MGDPTKLHFQELITAISRESERGGARRHKETEREGTRQKMRERERETERDAEGYRRDGNPGSLIQPTGAFQNLKFGTWSVFNRC